MEDNSTTTTTTIVAAAAPTAAGGNVKKPPLDGNFTKKKKKKRIGAFALFWGAIYMLRHRSTRNPKPTLAKVGSSGMLKKLVGSMRLLHLSGHRSPPRSTTANKQPDSVAPALPIASSADSDTDENASVYGSATNLQELDRSESENASSTNLNELDKGSNSRYASPMNLLQLDLTGESGDDDEEEDEEEEGVIVNGGDEMIDAKAEEFIAQFYNQMRLQHLHSIERNIARQMKRGQ